MTPAWEDALVLIFLIICYLVKRLNQHFGSEIQDYVYATAFEYQQSDFHYFDVNKIENSKRIKKVDFGRNDDKIHELVINKF